jgi:hypothetical protein
MALQRQLSRGGGAAHSPRAQIFDCHLAVVDRAGQGHTAAHDQRLGQLKDNQGKAGAVQAGGDARRQVAPAAENDEKVTEEHGGIVADYAAPLIAPRARRGAP